MAAPHRIRRQRWQVRTATPAQGLAVRKRLRDEWEPALLPAFEAAFDAAAPGDAVVRIPRLEIRLRVEEGDGWMDALPALVREAVAEQLRLHSATSSPVRAAPGGSPDGPLSAVEDAHATLVHYLRTGALPWAATAAPAAERVTVLRAAARDGWRHAAASLRASASPAAAWFRLVQLLDEAEAAAFVEAFAAHLPAAWRRVLLHLLSGDGDAARLVPRRDTRLRIAAALVARGDAIALPRPASPPTDGEAMGTDDADATGPALLALLAGAVETGEAEAFAELVAVLAERTGEGVAHPRPRGRRASAGDRARRTGGARADGARSAEGDAAAAPPSSPGEEQDRGAGPSPRSQTNGDEAEAFPMHVDHAGLVLLHPFIPMLFRRLGIVEDVALPEERRPRAAALLHYLAAGHADVHEFELAMEKVLLGLRLADPLPVAEGRLEPGDAEEADGLLAAAISHWAALKNTSADGFRASFLLRPGLLRSLDDGWRLQVEHRPFDVLIGQLPWALSVVKFPWMPNPLHVEWQTTH